MIFSLYKGNIGNQGVQQTTSAVCFLINIIQTAKAVC
jgi:hypothetical protein